jgi:cob(I)alamin adenosyltransferase
MTDAENAQHPKEAEHADAMKVVQAAHQEKMAQTSDADLGLFVAYTGSGKGKSSSAFGIIARALGWGHKVGVVQFIKGHWITGERQFFARFAKDVAWKSMGEGFTWDVQDLAIDVAAATAALEQGAIWLASGDFDLVVMDEIHIALRYDYLTTQAVLAATMARHPRTSVVTTGRNAPQALVDAADLVSEMTEIKHPFQSGIKAKRGIDF